VLLALVTIGLIAAMVSHTGTALLALVVLTVMAIGVWRLGDATWGRALPIVALVVMIAAAAAYYGRFAIAAASQVRRLGGPFDAAERLISWPAALDAAYGWPAVLLAIAGATTMIRRRDRLTLMAGAWLAGAGVFLLLGLVTRIPMHADFVAAPAIALLAARGAGFLWRAGPIAQAASIVLLFATVAYGIHGWIAPLR
jgi:hypothetical protein